MMKDEKKSKNKEFLKEVIVIIVVGAIVNLACFFMCSITGHCATGGDSVLPYMVNTQDGYSLTQEEYSTIIGILADNNYSLGDNVIIFKTYDFNWYTYNDYIQVPSYEVWDLSSTDLNGSFSSGYSYSTFEFNNNNSYYYPSVPNSYGYSIQKNAIGGVHWYVSRQTGSANFRLFGSTTPVSVQNSYFTGSYIPYYPVYCSTNFYTSGGDIVLSAATPINPGTSEFTDSPLITGHALPSTPQAPTITAPTIDSSLSVVENIQNLFSWLGTTIKSLLLWVLQNIYDYLDKLIQNLKAFINAVITAINNGFMNVYNNIQSLFYPFISFFTAFAQAMQEDLDDFFDSFIPFIRQQISNAVSGISNLVDSAISIKNFLFGVKGFFDTYGIIWNQETWEETLDNSKWLDAVSDNTTTMSQFINGTLNVAEPQTLSFTFDFRNAYYNFGLVEFNLDWYQPYKHSVRLVFLTIIILNVVLYFIDEAPNWFSGGGSNKKGDK